MDLRAYLPSTKFIVMVGSLALSAGLVVGAQYITRSHEGPSLATTDAPEQAAGDWQASLNDVVAQTGIEAPQAPDPATLDSMLAQAHSKNLTTDVGRSLLLNLSSYTAQGLGPDQPTQEALVAQATAQINASASSTAYTSGDLVIVPTGQAALKAYGNAAMRALAAHPDASITATYQALGRAADTGDPSALDPLGDIGNAYAAIAHDLLSVPVPQTLAPLQLTLVNDYAAMAAAYPDMQTLLSDPLRGMAAVQRYVALTDEAARLLTSIAQALNKNGILFTKDEPGSNWSGLLSS